jgi:uncharacterized protein YeaO (DUF488 family)
MVYTANRFDKARHRGLVIDVTRTRRSAFAPSPALLADFKAGRATWEQYEQRYRAEMRSFWQRDPDAFRALVALAAERDVTLTCWCRGDETTIHCHRRLLAGFLEAIANRERGASLRPATDGLGVALIKGEFARRKRASLAEQPEQPNHP